MKKIYLLLPLALLFSCSPQERAQRKLSKAIALDPTILSTLDVKKQIDTLLKHDTLIKVLQRTDTSKSVFNCDSLAAAYRQNGAAVLMDNDRLKATIENIKGHPKIVVINKPVNVLVHDTLRLKTTVTVKATAVHERVQVKGFFYWTGIGFVSAGAAALAILTLLNWTGILSAIKKRFGTA
jgi:23S rRNA-/tRNA-specific pseudouridylate synthase